MAVVVVCGCSGFLWLWWLFVVVCGCGGCLRLWWLFVAVLLVVASVVICRNVDCLYFSV